MSPLNRSQAAKRQYQHIAAKIQRGRHHVIFFPPDCLVHALHAFGCDRGAFGRYDARQSADRGLRQLGKGATQGKGETVEQRITNLHKALKITPDEEPIWSGVAQAMRENAAAMQKLAADRAAQAPGSLTAVQDLKGYEKFARAHFEGLKNLIASFETLYNSMPDPQKKVADQVFQSYSPKAAASHK